MKQYEIKYGYWTGIESDVPDRLTNHVTVIPPDLAKSYAWAGKWVEVVTQVMNDNIAARIAAEQLKVLKTEVLASLSAGIVIDGVHFNTGKKDVGAYAAIWSEREHVDVVYPQLIVGSSDALIMASAAEIDTFFIAYRKGVSDLGNAAALLLAP